MVTGGGEVKDYTQMGKTEIRRDDRAVVDEGWIRAYLEQAAVGVLATAYDGQPFINSNLFVFHEAENAIYMHTARVGRTRANVEANPKVCFHTFSMGRLLPADEALEFSVEYAGVTVFGDVEIVEGDDEKERALQLLLDKYAPHLRPQRDYRAITPEELMRTAVYKILILEWVGKKKEVESNFPGAFIYGQQNDK